MVPEQHLPPCNWTFCIEAPEARNGSFLSDLMYNGTEYDFYTTEVEINDTVQYYCFNGMKHATDLSFAYQEAKCGSDNIWEAPAQWEQCVNSA